MVLAVLKHGAYSFRLTDTDEIIYWREAFTFSQHGFHGGQYSINELPAAAGFTAFGTHGPGFAMIGGLFGWLFGWHPASPLLMNVILLVGGVAGFAWMTRPSGRTPLLQTLLLMTFWPLAFWMPTGMQESFHYAAALLLAGSLWRMWKLGARSRDVWVTAGLLVLVSMVRPTWSLVTLPWGGILWHARPRSRWVVGAGVLVFIVASFGLSVWWSSPYPTGFVSTVVEAAGRSPVEALSMVVRHSGTTLREVVMGAYGDEKIEHGFRLQYLGIVVVLVGAVISCRLRCGMSVGMSESLIVLGMLVPVLLVLLALYDVTYWRAYRVLSPHLLLAWMFMSLAERPMIPWVAVATSFMLASAFMPAFLGEHRGRFASDDSADVLRTRYVPHLACADGGDRWQNTLLIELPHCTHMLTALPSCFGVGLIVKSKDRPLGRLKSRYVLLSSDARDLHKQNPGLKLLTEGPLGRLYLNAPVANPH